MRQLVFILVIGILTSSCLEENNIPSIGNRLLAIYVEDMIFLEYEYDRDGSLIADKGKIHYFKYLYDKNNGRFSKEVYFDSRIFSSNSNVLQESIDRTEWVNPQNTALTGTLVYEFDSKKRLIKSIELKGYSEYEYNNNGRISARKMFHDGRLSGIREYEYDQNGNVIKDSHFLISENASKTLSNTTQFEYDDMKNPYQFLRPEPIPGENTNPNNVTRAKYTVKNTPEAASDIQYTYLYNDLGWPIERNDGLRYKYSN
ncbi:MAG: hypothetical protein EA341_02585 [Mongoliibacter sp.]|uniref:hypothetical protein n=1 Tax=Mongoliibacter sp. TaxID=2022438 RepID=UPI0012F329B5|nr:hypothetical protein [Mongoliibacter sp.]TVP52769.1 MAG: hypothetical protein EA341_02585 [Mongoliibacter sp.]